MTTISTSRPTRRHPPDRGLGPIEVIAPPRRTESMPISGSMGMILVPAASGVGAVLLAVTQQSRPLLAAAGLLVLAASIIVGVVMVVSSRTGDRRRTREQRERYLEYLERVRQDVRESAAMQEIRGRLNHPSPSAAMAAAFTTSRRWERRPRDADFFDLRIGLGPVPPRRPLKLGFQVDDPLVSYDEVCLWAARGLLSDQGPLADQPIVLPLGTSHTVSIRGERSQARAVARALIAQLAWAHSPQDAGILLISGDPVAHWDWLKWLPHNLSGAANRGLIDLRLTARTISTALALLSLETDSGSIAQRQPARKLVLLVDLPAEPAPPTEPVLLHAAAKAAGAVLILLSDRGESDHLPVDILVTGSESGMGSIEWVTQQSGLTHCSVDQLSIGDAIVLARSFAPLRPIEDAGHSGARPPSMLDSVRSVDVSALDAALTWRQRERGELFRVPIGVKADGTLVALDLKESAAGGMGPHGLVVGATGSGKSELLRTLVTTLVISHPPEALALLLADFKGGATFSGFAALPHIAGMVTNLEADLGLIDRFRHALSGELQRRQELLAAAGKLSSLDAYQQLRGRRSDLPALPRLLVIVDEFSELLGAKPDLAELFVTIGRIGRSIGIHLLLATQRLDTGRIRGLESHLSYRICLRTFSEAESREAIGSPAAYRLPTEPGWAYLVADTTEPVRFRASTVSRPYHQARTPRASTTARILPFLVENEVAQRMSVLAGNASIDAHGPTSSGITWGRQERATILDVVVDRLTTGAQIHRRGRAVRPVWLEPLPAHLELGALNGAHSAARPRVAGPRPDGTQSHGPPGSQPPLDEPLAPIGQADGVLTPVGQTDGLLAPIGQADGRLAPMGLVDIPERQCQDVFAWDFDSGNGNLLIVGAGRSGKSTAVGALLCSLASCYEPVDITMLCVDFGGEKLTAYRELPHVAAVATRSDPELTRLLFSRLNSIVDEREALFRQYRLNSAAALRRARGAKIVDQAVPGTVVLIIDGWAGLRDAEPRAESALDEILSRGPGLGVHTVMTISAAGQLRTRLAAGFAGRIELRLGDSFDSAIDRHLAKALPADRPGRALIDGSHYAQIALPQAGASQQGLVDKIRQRWPGPGVPRIQTLPAVVALADIQSRLPTSRSPVRRSASNDQLVLGVAETDMTPVQHALGASNPHLLIYGDTGSGRTSLLRSILAQLTSTRPDGLDSTGAVEDSATPDDEMLAVDYRRGLSTPAANYRRFTTPSEASALCAALSSILSDRLAGAPTEPDGNSKIYLLVDDYELVCAGSGNPLHSLLPFLPHARDIGFHLVLARRSGGAARAQYEPLLQALGDLGTPVLLLSGAPTEGRLGHGLVPQQFPPGRAQFAMRGAPPRIIQIGLT